MPGGRHKSGGAHTSIYPCAHAATGNGCVRRNPTSYLTHDEWCSMGASLGLSERQLQIVQRVFDGQDEASISRVLDISPHTVHTHMERLYRKLGVRCRCELIVRVFLAYLSRHSVPASTGFAAQPRASQRP